MVVRVRRIVGRVDLIDAVLAAAEGSKLRN